MAKMTKAQAKRMVRDIEKKTKKLFLIQTSARFVHPVSTADMQAIEKLCSKWLKRIG